MIDPELVTAIASTAGVTTIVSWRFFVAFNSKTDKTTTERIFKLTDVQGKEIAEMGKGVAVMGRDVEHLGEAVSVVGRNVEEILRNGNQKKKEVGGQK